ncbi:hypothetical protein LR48_Vigan08g057200, partial [Vigna angularis]
SSDSNSNPPARPSQPIIIQPVSYLVKPKSPQLEPSPESSPPPAEPQSLRPPSDSQRAWRREDIRYVKDATNARSVVIVSLQNLLHVFVYGEHAYSATIARFSPNGDEEMMPKPKEEQEVRKVVIRKESFGDSELEGSSGQQIMSRI